MDWRNLSEFLRGARTSMIIGGVMAVNAAANAQVTDQISDTEANATQEELLVPSDAIADLIRANDDSGTPSESATDLEALPAVIDVQPDSEQANETSTPGEIVPNDNAAENDPAPRLAAVAEGRANPAMWRLADEDSEIWLLGTFHILPKGLDWRSDALAHAADTAETFYFEAEVDSPDAQKQFNDIVQTEGTNPNGVTLTGLLEPSDAELLKAIASRMNVPIAKLNTSRPWRAFFVLSMELIIDQGFDPGSGVETVLLREARIRGRDLRFFETVEEQIRLFTSLTPQVEKDLLALTLREWETQEEQFRILFDAWRNGDVKTIDTLMNDSMREKAPEVYQALLAKRNGAWADEIDKIMSGDGKVLIAVGAAHLVGRDSVLALLREKGYEVTRYRDSE